ncbi:MAG TPA: long-chain fatty acid--CoA ligase [Gaiellaceae bacterium]|nr:long-chain fatty acid--CoA ligase [Gaiellaceae bacterium]
MINRVIEDRARNTPDRIAIDDGLRLWTYAELNARADELAAAMAPGERVATLTASSAEHVAVFFACAKAGAILLPLSWRLSPRELAFQLDDAEPALLLAADELAPLADEALALASGRPARAPSPSDTVSQGRPAADDPLLLVYTSGTTGKPKGALLTHANCFWTNLSFDLATGIGQDDVVLQVLPQFHVGGWNVQPLLAWWKGATVVLERGFDPARALRLIEEKRVTTMMGVPATYLFMANEPGFERADLSSLRRAVVGGAPMPEALLETWHRRGVDIVQGYGLTEAAPNVLCLAPEDAVRKLGWAGKPYPYVDVELSAEGELLVRGPNVFAGYWRNPQATAEAFAADGLLRTGDLAERDDEGNYRIRGRLKDLVISGGENVYPAEVEAVLHEHPAVVEAAVVGRPDARWGEVCVAFVVLREEVGAEELVEFCRGRLARFKVPKEVRFVEALPRSGMNKVLKDELRAVFA